MSTNKIKTWDDFKPVFESTGYKKINEKSPAEDQIKITYLDFIDDGKSKKEAIEKTAKIHRVNVEEVSDLIKDINEGRILELLNESDEDAKKKIKEFFKSDDKLAKQIKNMPINSTTEAILNTLHDLSKDNDVLSVSLVRKNLTADQLKYLRKITESEETNEFEDLNESLAVIVHPDDKAETAKILASKGIKYSSKKDKNDIVFIIKDLGHIKPNEAKDTIEMALADHDINSNVKSISIKESDLLEESEDYKKSEEELDQKQLKDFKNVFAKYNPEVLYYGLDFTDQVTAKIVVYQIWMGTGSSKWAITRVASEKDAKDIVKKLEDVTFSAKKFTYEKTEIIVYHYELKNMK